LTNYHGLAIVALGDALCGNVERVPRGSRPDKEGN
jgi:hypothetical protein